MVSQSSSVEDSVLVFKIESIVCYRGFFLINVGDSNVILLFSELRPKVVRQLELAAQHPVLTPMLSA